MNEPKLRFKTDDGSRFPDLKKISLESLMTFKNGINAGGSKFGHGVKCISVMDILNNAYITHDIIKGAVNIDEKTLSNFSVEYGDVLFQRSSENVQDAGRANVYIDKDKIATYSGFVIRGKKISEYEPVFMNNLLNTFTVRKQIMSKAQGAQHINIGQEILSSIAVKIPCLPEQQKIASLFTELDGLIQSAEKELEGYRELKQGMLQKMFPKKGEKVPEIRFPEFTGDWKQCKLGELLTERNIQHPQSREFPLVSFTVENGVTPKTDRYEREQLVQGDKKAKKYKETRLDDIVYNPANLKFGAISRNKFGNAVFSPIYITYGVNVTIASPAFLEMLVTRDSFIQEALQYQQGTVYERMSVSSNDFLKLDVTLPAKEEQLKIGEYFSNLDNLITLHQKEIDGYKELKKGLLQQMFC